MAINDVSLTSGMRSNLLSLQGTVNLLDRTQERLSTGKKVNSAIDNPVSFFAARSLTSRASLIEGLKDTMGQAVQTVTAADKGISAISAMIEQAKGIAQSALSAEQGTAQPAAAGPVTGAIRLNSLIAGGPGVTRALFADIQGITVGTRLDFVVGPDPGGGETGTFTADLADDYEGGHFLVNPGDMTETAANLAALFNNFDFVGEACPYYYEAEYYAGTNSLALSVFDAVTHEQISVNNDDFYFNVDHGDLGYELSAEVIDPDAIDIGGVTFTATSGATGGQNFNVSGNDEADMEELVQAINDYAWGDTAFSATVSNGLLNLSKTVNGTATDVTAGDFSAAGVAGGGEANMTLVDVEEENKLNLSFLRNIVVDEDFLGYYRGHTLIAAAVDTPFDDASIYFTVGESTEDTVANMAEAVNTFEMGHPDQDSLITATANGSVLSLYKTDRDTGEIVPIVIPNDILLFEDTTGVYTLSTGPVEEETTSEEMQSLIDQYNTIRTQLSELAEDSGYKGKNLLSDDDLVVKFEGASLTVSGFDATATGLGITAAAWASEADINASIAELDAAATTLSSESSKLSGNLSIITVRQNFSTNMVNTLTEGADKLTLADTNEEGANMLMLQTRQSLSTTALSLSAQAAQSVLQLFR